MVSDALALGLPVIATRHGGLPEQVIDGENGFVVDEGDYQALAERILHVSANPGLLAVLGKNGRAHVARHYDASALIRRQIDAYTQLAAEASPAPATRADR